jgi:hypothetical protein
MLAEQRRRPLAADRRRAELERRLHLRHAAGQRVRQVEAQTVIDRLRVSEHLSSVLIGPHGTPAASSA